MFTTKVNYIVLDDQTYPDLLDIKMYNEITDESPGLTCLIGVNNGGMKLFTSENGDALQIYLSDMEFLTRSLNIANYLNTSKQPIGDISAVIEVLKPFL